MVQTTRAGEEFLTSSEATTLPRTTRGMPGWLGLLVVLALIAASFTGGVLTGRATGPDPVGLAPQSIVDTIDEAIRLSNAGDEAGYAALWTEHAVFSALMMNQSRDTTGADAIAADYVPSEGMERTSEVIQQGGGYAYAYREAHSAGLIVLRFDGDGLITQLWMIG